MSSSAFLATCLVVFGGSAVAQAAPPTAHVIHATPTTHVHHATASHVTTSHASHVSTTSHPTHPTHTSSHPTKAPGQASHSTSATTAKTTTAATTTGATTSVPTALPKNPKLVAKLQALLPTGLSADQAAMGFRNQGQFVAAVHVSHNLGIPFADLRTKMVTDGLSLGGAIQALKPAASAALEADRANRQAAVELDENEQR